MRKNSLQPPLSTEFRFDNKNKISLCSYVPKKNKAVILLSSSHFSREVVGQEGKPIMTHDYNKSKGAVDQLDENFEEFTVRRKTIRWPMVVFYNMVDVVCFKSYITAKQNGYSCERKTFLKNLAVQLSRSYMIQRQECRLLTTTLMCIRLFLLIQGTLI